MKSKYDWKGLKAKFFKSEISEVRAFFDAEGIPYNRFTREKAKGWGKEKQARGEGILQDALEKSAKKEADNLQIPVDQLMKAKMAVIGLFMNKLNKTIEKQKKSKDGEVNFSVKEFEQILKVIKTELGEPTNISKTDATIKTEPIDEDLLIRD